MAETGERVTRKYSHFRGVDFRGEDDNLARSPDALNVWKDYRETESIRTRPGLALFSSLEGVVYGVFFYTAGGVEMCLAHVGDKLYRIVNGEATVILTGVAEQRSRAFIFNNIWYFKDGAGYYRYDGSAVTEVEGYVPTTSIAREPADGGTIHEDVNLLSPYRKNSFISDGTSVTYYLDAQNIDSWKPEVTVNGEPWTGNYIWSAREGWVTFTGNSVPPAPLTDGQDNVVIKFKKTLDGDADKIGKCTMLEVFDNRVFFSGNSDYPNAIWHCSLNDPTYCSDKDYYYEGLDAAAVKGMVAGNNALWVFREPSQMNTTIFYHTPTIDSDYGKIYPNTHSSISVGCIGAAVNFNDDIVFFSNRGMEGISGDITTEQVVGHRSSLVDRKMLSESAYENMILAEHDGYLFVFIGTRAYLADSRAMFTNENHAEYEWFYFDFGRTVTSCTEHKGVLYIGTANGIYTLTDAEADVESYWVTPKDRFAAPQKLKTTNKRGCVAEATGDIALYAKLEDTDFEPIGSYEGVTDYFVSRIKRKKFKDIQLKFHSKTRFSLESATLECFIGGYIKR
jgi:hypothetical protein